MATNPLLGLGAGNPSQSAIMEWLGQLAQKVRSGATMTAPGQLRPESFLPGGRSAYGGAAEAAFPSAPTRRGLGGYGMSADFGSAPAAAPSSSIPPVASEPSSVPLSKTNLTEPDRAALRFSWGSGTPEDYNAGITDILQMEGAPATRSGFMGASPAAEGTMSGGLAPSETDWSNVANPMAFSSYTDRPLMKEIEKATEDPLWRERETAQIEGQRDIGIAKAAAQAQADAEVSMREALVAAADQRVQQEIAAAEASGTPLTPEEQSSLVSRVYAAYGIDLGMMGMGGFLGG